MRGFNDRYGAVLAEDDRQLAVLVGYVAWNPVEAGLAEHPADWPWSSHARAEVDAAPSWVARDRLIGYFEAWGPDPARAYSEALAVRAGPPS